MLRVRSPVDRRTRVREAMVQREWRVASIVCLMPLVFGALF